MRKSHRRHIFAGLMLAWPIAVLANLTGNASLNTGQNFNFDTGAVVSSGGDIQFTGTAVNFVGSAKGGNLGTLGITGQTQFSQLTSAELSGLAAFASASPITASSLTAGTSNGSIVALATNGGNSAAFLVTALSSTSISFQYITFESGTGGGGGTSGLTITAIMNNSSTIPVGFPNGGVAPSSIIQVQGSNLANAGTTALGTLQNVYPSGSLPTTLGGASVKVTVGGTTVTPAFWYASPTQLALELPANTPAGTGTLTVTVGGNSSSSQITVVPNAFGIDVYNGNTGVLQDSVTGAIITPTNSAKTGEPITIWGTGLGSDPSDSDTNYTTSPHAINVPVQLYIGSVQVPASDISYVGSLGYPGVNGIVFTVPANAPSGCTVSIAVVINGVVSNVPTAAFMPTGGVCEDAYTGLSGTTISTVSGQGTVKTGSLFVVQATAPGSNGSPSTLDEAAGIFEQVTGSSSLTGSGEVSVGSCTITQALTNVVAPTVTGLDPGTVTVTPPSGSAMTLTSVPQVPGDYFVQLASGAIPTSGGTFAFQGSGGSGSLAVGPFNTTINFPNPIISWTNQSASATVTRSSGQTFTWTGGGSGTWVIVSGNSTSTTLGISGSYICIAPQSALTFTVPAYITDSLPAGTGTSGLENTTSFTSFKPSGLDYGVAFGAVSYSVNTTWK